MIITLNNGQSVDISFEQFDSMSDAQWKIFMDSERGDEINNPFFNSQLDKNTKPSYSESEDYYED